MRKTYLLKAPAEDLARWQADAKAAGYSFAAWIRLHLDKAGSVENRAESGRLAVQAAHEAMNRDEQRSTLDPETFGSGASSGRKKNYDPDPK